MSIESREDATYVAQQVVERGAKITTIADKLRDKDMLGLECAEAVQLLAVNATAGRLLAQWILRGARPRLGPRICLNLDRPNSPPYHIKVEGPRVTPPMLEAAEDLLHTLMTGERQLPKDLYEVVARAFGTTRHDAKERILSAIYGGKGSPVNSPSEESGKDIPVTSPIELAPYDVYGALLGGAPSEESGKESGEGIPVTSPPEEPSA